MAARDMLKPTSSNHSLLFGEANQIAVWLCYRMPTQSSISRRPPRSSGGFMMHLDGIDEAPQGKSEDGHHLPLPPLVKGPPFVDLENNPPPLPG